MNFFNISKEELSALRERYPVGARVELTKMCDPFNSVLTPGEKGTVKHVDDMGTIHVSWDCGSSLGVVSGEDSCRLIEQEEYITEESEFGNPEEEGNDEDFFEEFSDEQLETPPAEKTIKVVLLTPGKRAEIVEIDNNLEGLRKAIEADWIQAVYPFDDPVAVICDDEGKLNGKMPNRGLFTSDLDGSSFDLTPYERCEGEMYDVLVGKVIICGIDGENYSSLSNDLAAKYLKRFNAPEAFGFHQGNLSVTAYGVYDTSSPIDVMYTPAVSVLKSDNVELMSDSPYTFADAQELLKNEAECVLRIDYVKNSEFDSILDTYNPQEDGLLMEFIGSKQPLLMPYFQQHIELDKIEKNCLSGLTKVDQPSVVAYLSEMLCYADNARLSINCDTSMPDAPKIEDYAHLDSQEESFEQTMQ